MTLAKPFSTQWLASAYGAGVSVLLTFLLARLLGPENFGSYNYILTLASLQGIADLLTGEGIRFTDFEMNFKSKNKLITIDELYAIGPAISILMNGYIQSGKLVSLRGTLVPATTLNKMVGSIPVLGNILVGKITKELKKILN